MNPRVKAILGGAATIVVLAAVIIGLWAFSSPRKSAVQPVTIQLKPGQESLQYLAQGKDALSRNDTATAVALFQKALTIDPGDTSAQQALASVTSTTATSTTAAQSSSTTTKTPVAPDPWLKKVDTKRLLPTKFAEYTVGARETVGADTQVTGTPLKSAATVTSIVWTIHDRTTTSAASKFVQKVTKTLYAKDVANPVVHGISTYFGTDGARFASVAFVRGRYVFEVVITSNQAPSSDESLAVQAAAAFGTTPK